MVLADADVMIDVFRRYPPGMRWLESIGRDEVVLPGFVVMELYKGCRTASEQRDLQQVLRGHQVVWPEPETCDKAVLLFAARRLRYGIGILDTLVAQLAIDMDTELVTFNRKHYAGIPELRTRQPYKRTG